MKQSKSKPTAALTVEDYGWGCVYQGSKAALIAAYLALPEHFPAKLGDGGREYFLPLDWSHRPNTEDRWEATVSKNWTDQYSVFVSFSPDKDLAVKDRTEPAVVLIRALLELVQRIPPVPLSVRLGIGARRGKGRA